MEKLVVFTGAGISAESGLQTFRDSGGLWEGYDIEKVATPQAWAANPQLVLQFYNERRRNVAQASPNAAHLALVELERCFDTVIITQNIDDLHERAGSKKVIHLHGEIFKARSTADPGLLYSIRGTELNLGDCCELGSQLRPHIVWFGEAVPAMQEAMEITRSADIFVVIGTSLTVYPAAGLMDFAPEKSDKYFIDPRAEAPQGVRRLKVVRLKAAEGVVQVVREILKSKREVV